LPPAKSRIVTQLGSLGNSVTVLRRFQAQRRRLLGPTASSKAVYRLRDPIFDGSARKSAASGCDRSNTRVRAYSSFWNGSQRNPTSGAGFPGCPKRLKNSTRCEDAGSFHQDFFSQRCN
jgi:hypothetical protein